MNQFDAFKLVSMAAHRAIAKRRANRKSKTLFI